MAFLTEDLTIFDRVRTKQSFGNSVMRLKLRVKTDVPALVAKVMIASNAFTLTTVSGKKQREIAYGIGEITHVDLSLVVV